MPWKNSGRFFHAMENFSAVFPRYGKSGACFSRLWKKVFHSVENRRAARSRGGKGSLAADEVFDFGEELGGVAEAAVDGGEAEEGDFVELF